MNFAHLTVVAAGLLVLPLTASAQGMIPPGCLSNAQPCYDGTLSTSGSAGGQTYFRGYIGGLTNRTTFLFTNDANFQTVLAGAVNAYGRVQAHYTTISCPAGTPAGTGTRVCGSVRSVAVRAINVP